MNISNRVDTLQRVFNFQERPLKYTVYVIITNIQNLHHHSPQRCQIQDQ